MKAIPLIVILAGLMLEAWSQSPIQLHPENPHYFLFRNKPTVLIASAEHYGMVLNTDLDYVAYLDVLQEHGFNQTRIFSGAYCEGGGDNVVQGRPADWGAVQNTLAPRPGKFITPWKRSEQPGYFNGGNKFDLDNWDENYFERLKDFCAEAGKRNIVVEIVLFTANYTPGNWLNSPLHIDNNINGVGAIPYNEFHLTKHQALLEWQLEMTKKIVREVNAFDNVYFEICNEPYWLKGIPEIEPSIKEQQFLPELEVWQKLISETIVETEKELFNKHLIALNIANTYHKVDNVNENVSILNFHYARPSSVIDNYSFNRPIGFDETANGTNASQRRKEAWPFILGGGAVYSNLDWSFATDDVTGLGENARGPKLNGEEVRNQLSILKSTLESFDFIHASPIREDFRSAIPSGVSLFGLAKENNDYLLYIQKNTSLKVDHLSIPPGPGQYSVAFIDPVDGSIIQDLGVEHEAGQLRLALPEFAEDLIVRLMRAN